MLTLLEIENIAVIKKATVEMQRGFNVITGETGAGKSLIMECIGLALGNRARRDIIRDGEDCAVVKASFFCPDINDFLTQNDLYPEEDSTVILTRKIYRDGRSVCKCGSETVPLSTLKAVGARLAAVHGQHDSVALLSAQSHLSFVDAYCRLGSLAEEYAEKYKAYRNARQALEEAKQNAGQRESRIDYLGMITQEIASANLKDGEEEELVARQKLLSNSEELISLARTGSEAAANALDGLEEAASAAEEISETDPWAEESGKRLREMYYELQEIRRDLNAYASKVECDPEELAATEQRLGLIYRLERKYGLDIKSVLEFYKKSSAELEELLYVRDNGEEMEKKAQELLKQTKDAAKKITELRKKKGEELCRKICEQLEFLDMPKTRIELVFTPCDLWEKGAEKCEFFIAAGGGDLRPLNKIASGGELSRIMLAMKSAFSDSDDVPVLIFDEIDTGVSGRAAEKIGLKLRELAQKSQVLCITHLPVIAATANHHLVAEKDMETLSTTVHFVENEQRVREIARIMCGDSVTQAALDNAAELLKKEKS